MLDKPGIVKYLEAVRNLETHPWIVLSLVETNALVLYIEDMAENLAHVQDHLCLLLGEHKEVTMPDSTHNVQIEETKSE